MRFKYCKFTDKCYNIYKFQLKIQILMFTGEQAFINLDTIQYYSSWRRLANTDFQL